MSFPNKIFLFNAHKTLLLIKTYKRINTFYTAVAVGTGKKFSPMNRNDLKLNILLIFVIK